MSVLARYGWDSTEPGTFQRPVGYGGAPVGLRNQGVGYDGQTNESTRDSGAWFKESMPRILILKELSKQSHGGNGREIGRLDGADVVIGREAQQGKACIVVPSQSISREHGFFAAMGKYWFYRDQGSTNGSWLNGKQLPQQKWRLIRPGDLLQLADMAMEIVVDQASQPAQGPYGAVGIRSLLVFSRGEFLEEYPVPEYGRALVIGGSKADLRLDVDVHELPSLVVERRGDTVVAFSIAKEEQVFLNDKEVSHTTQLADGDEVRVAHYSILYNSGGPQAATTLQTRAGGVPVSAPQPIHPSSGSEPQESNYTTRESEGFEERTRWVSDPPPYDSDLDSELSGFRSARVSERIPFGKAAQMEPMADETIMIDAAEVQARISGYDVHPAMRHTLNSPPPSFSVDALEDKIIIGVGLVMLLSLVGLVTWWVLS